MFTTNSEADSLVSVMEVEHNRSPESLMILERNYLINYIDQDELTLRRQDKKQYYARNGAAIYITKWPNLDQFIFGGQIIPYVMDKISSIDLDDLIDWKIAEALIREGFNG